MLTLQELNEQLQDEIIAANKRYHDAVRELQKTCQHPEISQWENALAYDVKRCKICNFPVQKRVNEEYAKTGVVRSF